MVTETSVRNWFDKRYAEKGLESMRRFEAYPVYLDYLRVEHGKKLLDIGCGTGFLLKEASRRGLETYGVDLSREAVRLARIISPESEILMGKGEDLGFKDNFLDYVTCIATLEHFLEMEEGLQEMRRVCRGDGQFCLMVPNSNSLQWRIATTVGAIAEQSNENAYALDKWTALFSRCGFEVLNIFRDRWYVKKILTTLSLNPSVSVEKLLMKVARPIVPLKYANQFVFILEKAGS